MGQQYSGYIEGGYTYRLREKRDLFLTPLISFRYMRLHLDGYSESGAGVLNLNVDSQDYNFLQSGLGGKLAYPFSFDGIRIVPEVRAKWLYEFISDRQQATATFTGGGASFSTRGFDPPRSSYDIGARLTLVTADNVTLSLNYDFEKKRDFYSHNGSVDLRVSF